MLSEPGLVRLLAVLSPAFPVGGFTYSHGLEHAVEEGLVASLDDLTGWLGMLLTAGAGRVDAILLCAAWRTADDAPSLAEVTAWAEALRGTSETALESAAQGRAFLDTVRRVWPDAGLEAWARALEGDRRGAAPRGGGGGGGGRG